MTVNHFCKVAMGYKQQIRLVGGFLIVNLLLVSIGAAGDPSLQQDKNLLYHELTIVLDPEGGSMRVDGTIHVPSSRIDDGLLTLATSQFFSAFAPQLAAGYGALSITSITPRDVLWDRLWDIRFEGAPIPKDGITLVAHYTIAGEIQPQFAIRPEGSLAGSSGDAWYPQLAYAIPDVGTLTFHTRPGDLVIAPGTRISTSEDEAEGIFIFENRQPVKFGFAAGPYTEHRSDGSGFSIYALSNIPHIDEWSSKTEAAYEALTKMFGRSPYGTSALVEVDFPTIVLGVGEQGYILADDSEFENYEFMYWAHEFAHQWWGIAIRAKRDEPAGTLFTEGLAEFSALLVLEAVEGMPSAAAFRKGCLPGDVPGLITRFFRQVDKNADHELRDWQPESQPAVLAMHRLSTSRGPFVLSMLADIIGRDTLLAGLRQFIRDRQFGTASWRDVEMTLGTAAGQDLEWFFDQWLGRPGVPDLQLKWSAEGGKVQGHILQPVPAFRLPVDIELLGENNERQRHERWIDGPDTAFSFAAAFEVNRIILDPDYKVLRRPLASDIRCTH